jgi:hypothetical protein
MAVRYFFNTAGEYVAFQNGSHVFLPDCTWVGRVEFGDQLFAPDGTFIGHLLNDDRIARFDRGATPLKLNPVLAPLKPLRPLAPLRRLRMLKLPYGWTDVFEHGIAAERSTAKKTVTLDELLGSTLMAYNGAFLGNVNKDRYAHDSLSNRWSVYSNKYNMRSVFSQLGVYGNPYSTLSSRNQFARTPPRFLKDGAVVAHLTANVSISPRVDPDEFERWIERMWSAS